VDRPGTSSLHGGYEGEQEEQEEEDEMTRHNPQEQKPNMGEASE
jgi:hypothetical protein